MVALSKSAGLLLVKPSNTLFMLSLSRIVTSRASDRFFPLICTNSTYLRSIQHFSNSLKATRHSYFISKSAPTRHHSSAPGNQAPPRNLINESSRNNRKELKENIYTIPNYLTVGRFFISPFLGYMVLQEQFAIVCGLFIVTGLTDLLDGYIARNWEGQSSILGTVIDPLADKFLVTILAITLTAVHLIPAWLTALVLSRDVYLVLSGFRVRWKTLPPPKTFKRYFDFSHPTAQVQPSLISKVNTNVQLLLLTATCAAPVFGYVDHMALQSLWGVTAVTTAWSFVDYLVRAPYTTLKEPS